MASLSLKASPGNKSRLTEPGSNPNWFRKVFEILISSGAAQLFRSGFDVKIV